MGNRPASWQVASVLARSVGEPALARALPLYLAIAIVASVLFGPTGISAADVTGLMADLPGARLALWAAWLVGIAPAVRVAVRAEPAIYLRALPIPLVGHLAFGWLVALALQAPWVLLFARGDGAVAAIAAGAAAAAIASAVAIPARGWADDLFKTATAGGLVAAVWFAIEPEILAAAAGAVFALAAPAAWSRSPERASRRSLLAVRGPAPIALGLSALAFLWRRRRSIFGRGLLWAAAGAGAVVLAARANDVGGAGLAALTIAIGAPAMAAALGGAAAAIVEHERGARWLLDSTGAGGGLRVAAAAAPAVTLGLLAGAGYGVAIATAAGEHGLAAARLVGHGLVAGGGWALIALAVARWTARRGRVDGGLVVGVLLPVALAIAVATAFFGEATSMLVVALAAGGALTGADRADAAREA